MSLFFKAKWKNIYIRTYIHTHKFTIPCLRAENAQKNAYKFNGTRSERYTYRVKCEGKKI